MTETYKAVIEANGGAFAKVEYWGVKSLAYRIKKNRKAHYALLQHRRPARGRRRDGAPDGASTKTSSAS